MATQVRERGALGRRTPRVERLYERYLHAPMEVCVQRSRYLTEYMRQESDPAETMVIRQARRLAHILENLDITIYPDELIVGAPCSKYYGAMIMVEMGDLGIGTPRPGRSESSPGGLAAELRHMRERPHIPMLSTDQDIAEMDSIAEFWKDRGIGKSIARYTPPPTAKLAAMEGFFSNSFPANIHMAPNFGRLLTQGCEGIMATCDRKLAELGSGRFRTSEELEKKDFYEAVKIAYSGLMNYASRCAARVREAAAAEADPERKSELESIAEICERVPAEPARSFHEAIQSMWFLIIAIVNEDGERGMDPGRMDQYLYPFYKADVDAGVLDEDQAVELLSCFWLKLSQFLKVVGKKGEANAAGLQGRHAVTIGGVKRDGSDAVNDLSYAILRSIAEMKTRQPNLMARFHKDSPREFRDAVSEVIKTGGGFPGLFNDETHIPMYLGHGMPIEDARDYMIIGCVEPAIQSCHVGDINMARLNLPMCLEMALFNGHSLYFQQRIGPETGDPTTFTHIDQLIDAFCRQVAFVTEQMMVSIHAAHIAHREEHPDPLMSAVMDDCLERGLDKTRGGGRYSHSGINSIALADVGDSLAAIDRLVFKEHAVTMAELLQALRDDFQGHELLYKTIMNRVPKYGNDVDEVDRFTRIAGEIYGNELHKYPHPIDPRAWFQAGLESLGSHTKTALGRFVGAMPNGRRAWEGFSNSISPRDGQERNGPTAVMRSASKLDYRCLDGGVSLNQKFTPSVLAGPEGTRNLSSLVNAYFAMGGQHVQFNVVDRATLLDAQENPSRYPGLMVRVSGYSAHFVHLSREMQDEIINRTEYAL